MRSRVAATRSTSFWFSRRMRYSSCSAHRFRPTAARPASQCQTGEMPKPRAVLPKTPAVTIEKAASTASG
jgi:hypothetical protein